MNFQVNDAVMARWLSGDKGFYPAKIVSVTGSSTAPIYTVKFKSYDTVETLRAKDVKPVVFYSGLCRHIYRHRHKHRRRRSRLQAQSRLLIRQQLPSADPLVHPSLFGGRSGGHNPQLGRHYLVRRAGVVSWCASGVGGWWCGRK